MFRSRSKSLTPAVMHHGELNSKLELCFEWKIKCDYKFIKEMMFGIVCSNLFTVTIEGQKSLWWLQLFPTKNVKAYSSISVHSNIFLKEMNAKVHFSLFDKNNGKLKEITLDNNQWEASKFLQKGCLVHQKDNKITIICRVSPVNPIKDQKIYRSLNILDDFERLLLNKKFSDVTVVSADDKELHVHKAILASRSPVFETMFEHDMVEKKQNIVHIKDIKYEVLLEMFRFIYSNKVNELEKLLCELLVAAEKYSIQGLKQMCEETMIDKLDETNALEYLIEADRNNASFSKVKILRFIARNLTHFVNQPEFKSLSHPDLLHEIIISSAKERKL